MQERGCGRWTGNRKSIWSGLSLEPCRLSPDPLPNKNKKWERLIHLDHVLDMVGRGLESTHLKIFGAKKEQGI